MKRKALFSLLLAVVMLLSVASFAAPEANAEEAAVISAEAADIDAQLSLIHEKRSNMLQKDSQNTWYYVVTDLDHDGNLEFIAASQHPQDRSTNLKVWEVSTDRSTLMECKLEKDPDESFPDIMTDSTDTYHVVENDTWYYMCYDNIVISPTEVYTIKTSVNLKNGVIDYDAYAVEHTVVSNGWRDVSHIDANGFSISPEQYNAAGVNAFAGAERSNTSFEWLTAEDAEELTRLVDSYMVFDGMKEPTETFPVPKPAALDVPENTPTPTPSPSATPIPAPTPVPDTSPAYLMITKNPTNENRKPGSTALFVACANAFDSLSWTLVSPQGGEYSVQSFAYMFADAPVSGEYSTTLSIGNVARDMNGWGAYCTFYYKGQTARTSTAYIYVSGEPTPAPTPVPVPDGGVYYGSVSSWNYSSVSVNLDGTTLVAIPWDVVSLNGEIYYGAPATVYWNGTTTKGLNITWCSIEGSQPQPMPVYGSMSGTAYDDSLGRICIFLQNGSTVYVSKSICNIYGQIYAAGGGSSCTVYYTDYPSEGNIYQVDVYGDDGYDDGGWAGANYYENEYFGYDDDYDDGGWAGSNYYDNEYGYDDDYDDGGWAGSNYYDNEWGG